MNNDIDIFPGKKLSTLAKEIHKNSTYKKDQIDILIGEIRTHLTDMNSIVILLPLINELLNTGVKNDEHLIKLMAVVQRHINSSIPSGDSMFISDEEKDKILAEAKQIQISSINNSNTLKTIENKITSVIEFVEETK